MNLHFKNRIAFHYMIATAITMAVAFAVVYFVVSETVVRNLDNDLSYEAQKHTKEIKKTGDSIIFQNKAEWEEREHRETQVNPVFIQLIDKKGRSMDKSSNLKDDNLAFTKSELWHHFDTKLRDRHIRQVQLPLEEDGKIIGYVLAAMSSESAKFTLNKLRNALFGSYFMVLAGLYFISRFLAGKSILPVQQVTNTITRITQYNLKERVVLPQNKDEIYDLSISFNALLDRIEAVLERERQFTSDASHELRTPLATLRGTLEVLIRKPRNQQEYEDKIKISLSEIDKMSATLEQLLLLARLELKSGKVEKKLIPLPSIMDESLSRLKKLVVEKELKVDFWFNQNKKLLVPQYYTNLIIENILDNAIKYSGQNDLIKITIDEIDSDVVCVIQDQGIGISNKDLKDIFESFFRSDALNHKHISGTGLGLSIVKKCADAIKADLKVESILGSGTTVTIKFKAADITSEF